MGEDPSQTVVLPQVNGRIPGRLPRVHGGVCPRGELNWNAREWVPKESPEHVWFCNGGPMCRPMTAMTGVRFAAMAEAKPRSGASLWLGPLR